jgi:hypothetical protein
VPQRHIVFLPIDITLKVERDIIVELERIKGKPFLQKNKFFQTRVFRDTFEAPPEL